MFACRYHRVRSTKLNRIGSRFVLVMLLFAYIFGGVVITGTVHGDAKSADISAASKVLSQSGEVGKWTVQEPPNFPAVQCTYPSGTNQLMYMGAVNVLVYPRPGLASEVVEVSTAIKRRLPDGS